VIAFGTDAQVWSDWQTAMQLSASLKVDGWDAEAVVKGLIVIEGNCDREKAAASTTRRQSQGAGTAAMKYRAHALGGTLCFVSKRGGGTRVTCSLPQRV